MKTIRSPITCASVRRRAQHVKSPTSHRGTSTQPTAPQNKIHSVSHSPHCNSQRGGYARACCAPIQQPRDEMRRYTEHMQSCQSLHIRARVNASVRAYTSAFACRRARAPLCGVRHLELRLRRQGRMERGTRWVGMRIGR